MMNLLKEMAVRLEVVSRDQPHKQHLATGCDAAIQTSLYNTEGAVGKRFIKWKDHESEGRCL
jgi:hypothetical protein